MSSYSLLNIEICGFRGFTKSQKLALGRPLTLLSGGNRMGKSSIVNAIEWCLFGSEVAAIKYGDIRERDAWEVRNLGSSTCYVVCTFQSADGKTLRVKRIYKTPRTTDFSYELDGGEKSADEAKLHAHLQITPSDFVSSVHLHPEVVRSLIIAKPRERKEAVDRLLGLSDLRDMVEAFASEQPSEWTDSLQQSIDLIDAKLTTALGEKKKTIEGESAGLMTKGIKHSDLTARGALSYAAKVEADLEEFAKTYQLAPPGVSAPADFAGLLQFRAKLPSSIQRLRAEHPVLADRGTFMIAKNNIVGLRANHVAQKGNLTDAKHSVEIYPEKRDLEQIGVSLLTLKGEIDKLDAEMREISRNASVLDAALTFFRNRAVGEQLACPLCGETILSIEEWREHIQKEIIAKDIQPLRTRKEALVKESALLEKSKTEKAALLNKLSTEQAKLDRSTKEVQTAIGKSIAETDDPVLLMDAEIKRLDDTLAAMQQQFERINLSLDGFQQALLDLDSFQRIGKAQQEIAKIEAINENESYKQMTALRSEAELYAEDANRLIEGLQKVVKAEAQQRLALVQKSISETFTRITNRPDYPGLKVSTGSEGYVIELTSASSSTRAVPILNHADINCAALSIFLALAGSCQISHRLGIVILDDPSQSLDSNSKKSLASVLATLCDSRQVIVATADAELRDEIRNIPKNKISYLVKDWTQAGGPILEAEATSTAYAV
ncbi:MAG: AAA family ATPase [Candidatus Acidiferrum sp.]